MPCYDVTLQHWICVQKRSLFHQENQLHWTSQIFHSRSNENSFNRRNKTIKTPISPNVKTVYGSVQWINQSSVKIYFAATISRCKWMLKRSNIKSTEFSEISLNASGIRTTLNSNHNPTSFRSGGTKHAPLVQNFFICIQFSGKMVQK